MTPEGEVKKVIAEWLGMHWRICMFWYHFNGAVYDPRTRQFRKPNSKHTPPGVSDIIGIWHRAPLAIETKAPGSKTDPKRLETQIKFLGEVAGRGGVGILAYGLDDVLAALGDLKEKNGLCYIGTNPGKPRQGSLFPARSTSAQSRTR